MGQVDRTQGAAGAARPSAGCGVIARKGMRRGVLAPEEMSGEPPGATTEEPGEDVADMACGAMNPPAEEMSEEPPDATTEEPGDDVVDEACGAIDLTQTHRTCDR